MRPVYCPPLMSSLGKILSVGGWVGRRWLATAPNATAPPEGQGQGAWTVICSPPLQKVHGPSIKALLSLSPGKGTATVSYVCTCVSLCLSLPPSLPPSLSLSLSFCARARVCVLSSAPRRSALAYPPARTTGPPSRAGRRAWHRFLELMASSSSCRHRRCSL